MELKQQRIEEEALTQSLISRIRAFFDRLTSSDLLLLAPLQGFILLLVFFNAASGKGLLPLSLFVGFFISYFFRRHAFASILVVIGFSKGIDLWIYSLPFLQSSLQYVSAGLILYCFSQCLEEREVKQKKSQQSLNDELQKKTSELQLLSEKQFNLEKAFSTERQEFKQTILKLQEEVEMLSQLVKVADADAKAYYHELAQVKQLIKEKETQIANCENLAQESEDLKKTLRMTRDQLNDARVQLFQSRLLIQWKNFAAANKASLQNTAQISSATNSPKAPEKESCGKLEQKKQGLKQEEDLSKHQAQKQSTHKLKQSSVASDLKGNNQTEVLEKKTEDVPQQNQAAEEQEVNLQEQLKQREKDKALLKKQYYELLDNVSKLKARFQKDPGDEELKRIVQEKMDELKQQKSELVLAEKELFSLKKDLRDRGLLFNA